jgi:serine protease inhibitor
MAVFSELLCAAVASVLLVGTDGGARQIAAGDTNPVVTANGEFALDLYRQLAARRRVENLFFSPFSLSSVLAMAAEGARGETAMEMGKVLRFPTATRNMAADVRSRPWNTALIHAGMATLDERLSSKPVPKNLQERIASLRKQLDEANRAARGEPIIVERPGKRPREIEIEDRPPTDEDFQKQQAAAERSQELAHELNKLLPEVDLYELRAVNAVWCEKDYPFQPGYLETIRKFYRTAGAFSADFSGDAQRQRQRINAWIESQTSRRICDLIPLGGIDENARLVLTNAIYFKGQWLKPFEASETKDEDFTLAAGSKVRVPMMHHEHHGGARYAAFNADGTLFPTPDRLPHGGRPPETLYPGKGGFQIAESPYKGSSLAMAVILPRDADGLPALERKLTHANSEAWFGKLQQREIHLHLPKFRLETGYPMNEPLQALGMVRAFDRQTAEFDGISPGRGQEKLYVANVFHKAFVDVNEKGTFTSSQSKFDEARGFGASHVVSSKDPAAIATMLDFASRHHVAPQTEHFPMSKINEAFARLESGKARYRIVLDADF